MAKRWQTHYCWMKKPDTEIEEENRRGGLRLSTGGSEKIFSGNRGTHFVMTKSFTQAFTWAKAIRLK